MEQQHPRTQREILSRLQELGDELRRSAMPMDTFTALIAERDRLQQELRALREKAAT